MPTLSIASLALVLSSFTACAAAQTLEQRAAKDELVFMGDDEPPMRQAFQVARASLDDFLRTAAAGSPDHVGFALKVGIPQGNDVEYFWVNNFKALPSGSFDGVIDNEPQMVRTVKMGQRYEFKRSQIVDWMYVDKKERRMVGNFTLCALLTKEPKDQAEATRRRYRLDCSKITQ